MKSAPILDLRLAIKIPINEIKINIFFLVDFLTEKTTEKKEIMKKKMYIIF